MKIESAMALRTAIEKERADCMAKLDNELRLAKEVVEEKNREIDLYRVRTAALIEQGKHYKNTIDRLIEEFEFKSDIQQMLKEKVQYHVLFICDKRTKYDICKNIKKCPINMQDSFFRCLFFVFSNYYILIISLFN